MPPTGVTQDVGRARRGAGQPGQLAQDVQGDGVRTAAVRVHLHGGHLAVRRQAPRVDLVEVGALQHRAELVLAHPRQGLVVVDPQVHHGRVAQDGSRAGIAEGPAAQGEHGIGATDQLVDRPVLELAEVRLTLDGEHVDDGAAELPLEVHVAVDERGTQALGQDVPDRRLARPHETDQHDHRHCGSLAEPLDP